MNIEPVVILLALQPAIHRITIDSRLRFGSVGDDTIADADTHNRNSRLYAVCVCDDQLPVNLYITLRLVVRILLHINAPSCIGIRNDIAGAERTCYMTIHGDASSMRKNNATPCCFSTTFTVAIVLSETLGKSVEPNSLLI